MLTESIPGVLPGDADTAPPRHVEIPYEGRQDAASNRRWRLSTQCDDILLQVWRRRGSAATNQFVVEEVNHNYDLAPDTGGARSR